VIFASRFQLNHELSDNRYLGGLIDWRFRYFVRQKTANSLGGGTSTAIAVYATWPRSPPRPASEQVRDLTTSSSVTAAVRRRSQRSSPAATGCWKFARIAAEHR
jgi:hypothetical protein